MFPTRTIDTDITLEALTCTANFKLTDETGYSKTLLQLADSGNGPLYYWEPQGTHHREYYKTNDKAYMNYYEMDEWEFASGGTGRMKIF